MNQEVDSLSSCISLIDILSLLPPNDITSCGFVSRRLRDVIINNNKKMAKYRIDMALKAGRGIMAVCIRFRRKELRFDIDDDSVHMSGDHDKDIIKYFRRRGHRMRRKTSTIKKYSHLEDGDIYFSVDTLEDGLTLVLSHLFSLYQFDQINIKNARDMAPQLCHIIAEEFGKAQSFCRFVQCDEWLGSSFFDRISSQKVRIISWSEFSNRLPTIPFWECPLLKMRVNLNSQQPIVYLLRAWERVASSRPFEFHLKCHGEYKRAQEFFEIIKRRLTLSRVVYNNVHFDYINYNEVFTYSITRKLDSVQIILEYLYDSHDVDYKVKIYRSV